MTDIAPVQHIPLPEWMTSASLKRLREILGQGTPLYCVGGCVRDTLLGRVVGDIDLATVLEPHETQSLLEKASIRVFAWGVEHGTVTAYLDNRHFEITTFRQDVETDGRHAKVAFTKSLQSDAKRRDFTINALYLDFDGGIYDPTGRGLDDLDAKELAFIGEPQERLQEDYLRAYRYFRFCAQLGWGTKASYLPIFWEAKDNYTLLSSERKIHELTKIFACKNPFEIVLLMGQSGLLELADQANEKQRLDDFFNKQIRYQSYPFYARFFACFFEGVTDVSGLSDVLSSDVKKDMKSLAKASVMIAQNDSLSSAELLYRFGRDVALQAALWCEKNDLFLNEIQTRDMPHFPLKGADLIAAGMVEGEALGQAIKKAEQAWIASGFQLTLDECLKMACRE